jgi:hypothetical protein
MSTEQLEQRLAAVEKALAELRQRVEALANASQPRKWQPPNLPPLPPLPPPTPEEQKVLDDLAARTRYFRQTGHEPPPEWKPGDPIPEPEWWS